MFSKSYLKSKPVPKSWQNAHAPCLTETVFSRTPNLPDGLVLVNPHSPTIASKGYSVIIPLKAKSCMPTPKLRTTSKRTTTRLTDKAIQRQRPDNSLRITGGVSHVITVLSDFLRRKTDKISFSLCVFDEFYFVKLINKTVKTTFSSISTGVYSHVSEGYTLSRSTQFI